MATRHGIATIIALGTLSAISPVAGDEDHSEMRQHLEYARENLQRGAYGRVMAHTGLVLMDRPLKVHTDFSHVEPGRQGDCLAALEQGMQMWREALEYRVEFVSTARADGADLKVRFVPDLRSRGKDVAGYIDWKRVVHGGPMDSQGTLTADLRIRTNLPGGGYMSVGAMRHAMAHELGHVFGLGDRRTGIMGPVNPRRPVASIGRSEIEAVLRLRREAEDIRRDASLRAILLP